MDSFGSMYRQDILFPRPERLKTYIYGTMGDMQKLESAYEDYIALVIDLGIAGSPMRLGQLYEEMCVRCLEPEDDTKSLSKALEAYNNAAKQYQLIPGLPGLKYEQYLRAETGIWIAERLGNDQHAHAILDEAIRFFAQNMLGMPQMGNQKLRVMACRIQYEMGPFKAHRNILLDVRCKRRRCDKKARLPVGAVMKVSVACWEDQSDVLPVHDERVLDEAMLEHPVGEQRVVHFVLPKVDLFHKLYVCRIRVFKDEKLVAALDQPIVNHLSIEEANALQSKHVEALEVTSMRAVEEVKSRSF